jgi:hypothetical protein
MLANEEQQVSYYANSDMQEIQIDSCQIDMYGYKQVNKDCIVDM